MKACKVFCTYFGIRRGNVRGTLSPSNAEEALIIFKKNIEHELTFDHGVSQLDIIIMNNESDTMTQEATDYLNSINNTKTRFGNIKVFNRKNIGGSMGAYSEVFDKFENEYFYWFFSEDDVRIIYPKYYKMIIEEFEDPKLGFLAFTKIVHENNRNLTYVGGAFGASTTKVLSEVKKKYGKLQYDIDPKTIGNYGNFGHSELYFTNPILQMGYDIRIPKNPEIVPLADNWEQFGPQARWQQERKFNLIKKKFLIHIGL